MHLTELSLQADLLYHTHLQVQVLKGRRVALKQLQRIAGQEAHSKETAVVMGILLLYNLGGALDRGFSSVFLALYQIALDGLNRAVRK